MQQLHPTAQILRGGVDPEVEGQYLQIFAVSPHKNLEHQVYKRTKDSQAVREYNLMSSPHKFTTTSRQPAPEIPITEQVSTGAEVSGERGKQYSYSSRTDDDIVFAYQLHVIADRGWHTKRTMIDDFVPKGGFLGKDDGEQDADAVDATEATEEDLAQTVEDEDIKLAEARDGEETCICLYLEG